MERTEDKLNRRNLIAAIFALAICIPVGMVGMTFLSYHLEHRCTAADKALSQAPAFPVPRDYREAQAHPEKLRYAQTQMRAIQKCGW